MFIAMSKSNVFVVALLRTPFAMGSNVMPVAGVSGHLNGAHDSAVCVAKERAIVS